MMEKLALDACGKLFSMREAADILGILYQTVRRWTTEGRIDSVNLGARRLVAESTLNKLVAEGWQQRRVV
jgi:excisionase family DNA binding protein